MASGTRHRLLAGGTVVALVLTAGLLAGCGPPPGRVSVQGAGSTAHLVFTAAADKDNVVTVLLSDGALLVNDGGDTISPGSGCTAVDANTARCTGARFVTMDLGNGNDTASNNTSVSSNLVVSSGVAGIRGGPGDDDLNGGTVADLLFGDEDDDTLDGNNGDDILSDGRTAASTDAIDRDTFNGGPGRDIGSYSAATQRVNIFLDGLRNDGRSGEDDNVQADVENATGGSGADLMVGEASGHVLRGGAGGDSLFGNEGVDSFFGEGGDDLLFEGGFSPENVPAVDALDADTFSGGSGVDTVLYQGAREGVRVDLDDVAKDGRPGENDNVRVDVENVDGGLGADTLVGNKFANRLRGSGGRDVLDGKAGPDVLRGDSGFDGLDGGTERDDCDVGANGGTETNCEF